MRHTISNFFKVRRRIPAAENRTTSCKWSASHYAIILHGEADNISPDNLPNKDNIGECNGIISMEAYNKIKKITEKINAKYYSETDAAYNSMQTEATVSLIQNSAVVYSMLCTIFRTQSGYLAEDVDGKKLSPVIFNYSWHHSNGSDWSAGSENFAIVRPETNYNTQEKIKSTKIVDFAMSIANEPWNHLVIQVAGSIRLPEKIKELCEHMFTTVFMDPDAAYNPSFVIFQPASGWVKYEPTFENTKLTGLTASQKSLNGYDSYDENNGFDTPNTQSTYDDILNYFEEFAEYSDRMINLFPQLTEVLDELGIEPGSNFNFTRDLDHQMLLIIDNENVSDLVQSTAFCPYVDDEMGDYNESLSDMLHAAPVIVRDKERSHYGANLSYKTSIEIETENSYELFLQGKVVPLEYSYFEYHESSELADYVWTYLVPRELSAWDDDNQGKNVTLINSVLADTGAVVPIYNIVQNIMNNSTKGSYVTPRPTINCFYKTITNIAVMVEDALTSFYPSVKVNDDSKSNNNNK